MMQAMHSFEFENGDVLRLEDQSLMSTDRLKIRITPRGKTTPELVADITRYGDNESPLVWFTDISLTLPQLAKYASEFFEKKLYCEPPIGDDQ